MATRSTLVVPCGVRNCPPNNDLTIYNLQDALYFNGTALSVVANCPTGYYCPPGSFPRVFTYPPGTFVVNVPPDNGFPRVISIQGCESNLNTVLATGSTPAQISAASDILIAQAAAQQARCDSKNNLNRLPIPISLTSIFSYACVDELFSAAITASSTGAILPYSIDLSPVPAWMSVSQSPTRLFLSGTPTAIGPVTFTVVATSDGASGSKSYTLNVIGIATASTLPNGTVGVAYSETLDASSIPGVSIWTVTSGALPDGLSLDPGTGEISGTPTTEEGASFTIEAGNGEINCSKAFGLTVDAAPSAPNWSSINWIELIPQINGTGFITPTAVGPLVTYTGTAGAGFGEDIGFTLDGNFTYTGPATNCKVTVTGWTGIGLFHLVIVWGGVSIRLDKQQVNILGDPQVWTFTIPISSGETIRIVGGGTFLYGPNNVVSTGSAQSLNGTITFANQ